MEEELGVVIIDFLSNNNDKLYTMTALHNEITSTNTSLQFKDPIKRNEFNEKFRIEFLTLENNYRGIYRFIINDRQYIIWSTDTYEKLYEKHIRNTEENKTEIKSSITRDNVYINTEIETTNYYEMIKSSIYNREYKYIYNDIRVDGINNAIHLFVINNDIQNLKKINDIHKIDWTIKNRNNKTCLELAKENKNCQMIEYILNNIHDDAILNLKNIMENQKSIQKDIYEKSNKLNLDNMNLVNECQELKYNNYDLEAKCDKLWKINYITGLSLIYFVCRWMFPN